MTRPAPTVSFTPVQSIDNIQLQFSLVHEPGSLLLTLSGLALFCQRRKRSGA